MPHIHGPILTDDDLTRIRVDEVKTGDLVAHGRALNVGGYTAWRVGVAGPAGYSPDWDEDVWRIEYANGQTSQQPGRYPVLIVDRRL